MAAQRDTSGKSAKGGGAGPIADAGTSASKAFGPMDKVLGVFNKINQVTNKLSSSGKHAATGLDEAEKTVKAISSAGHVGAAAIAGFGAALSLIASAPIPSATQAMSGFADAIGSIVAGVGKGFNDTLSGIADKLEKLGPEAAAVAMAFRIVGASIQAATEVMGAATGVMGQMMGMAIEVSQKTEMMRARFSALAGSAAGGKAVLDMIERLGQSLPFATSQISEWSQSLMSAGFRGNALQTAVESVASATALMGESGGAAAEKLLKTMAEGGKGADKMVKAIREGGPKANKLLADMGLSVNDIGTSAQRAKMSNDDMGRAIEKALKTKGAGPLESMLMSFPSILQKTREGFMSMFKGLDPVIKPFMKEVQKLFSVFNKGGSATKGLKPIIGGVLADMFKWATKVVIVMQKIVAVLTKKSVLSAFGTALKVIGVIAQTTVELVLGFILVVMDIVGAVSSAIDALSKFGEGAMTAAGNFISGLVGGILGGIGDFVSAVSSLASAGLDAFRSIFKISSPSAVMDQMGGYVAEGAAQGVEGGQSRVEGAATKLGAGMAGASAKGAAGGSKGGGGKSVSVTIAAGAVTINAGGATITEEGLAIVLERLIATQGA